MLRFVTYVLGLVASYLAGTMLEALEGVNTWAANTPWVYWLAVVVLFTVIAGSVVYVERRAERRQREREALRRQLAAFQHEVARTEDKLWQARLMDRLRRWA